MDLGLSPEVIPVQAQVGHGYHPLVPHLDFMQMRVACPRASLQYERLMYRGTSDRHSLAFGNGFPGSPSPYVDVSSPVRTVAGRWRTWGGALGQAEALEGMAELIPLGGALGQAETVESMAELTTLGGDAKIHNPAGLRVSGLTQRALQLKLSFPVHRATPKLVVIEGIHLTRDQLTRLFGSEGLVNPETCKHLVLLEATFTETLPSPLPSLLPSPEWLTVQTSVDMTTPAGRVVPEARCTGQRPDAQAPAGPWLPEILTHRNLYPGNWRKLKTLELSLTCSYQLYEPYGYKLLKMLSHRLSKLGHFLELIGKLCDDLVKAKTTKLESLSLELSESLLFPVRVRYDELGAITIKNYNMMDYLAREGVPPKTEVVKEHHDAVHNFFMRRSYFLEKLGTLLQKNENLKKFGLHVDEGSGVHFTHFKSQTSHELWLLFRGVRQTNLSYLLWCTDEPLMEMGLGRTGEKGDIVRFGLSQFLMAWGRNPREPKRHRSGAGGADQPPSGQGTGSPLAAQLCTGALEGMTELRLSLALGHPEPLVKEHEEELFKGLERLVLGGRLSNWLAKLLIDCLSKNLEKDSLEPTGYDLTRLELESTGLFTELSSVLKELLTKGVQIVGLPAWYDHRTDTPYQPVPADPLCRGLLKELYLPDITLKTVPCHDGGTGLEALSLRDDFSLLERAEHWFPTSS